MIIKNKIKKIFSTRKAQFDEINPMAGLMGVIGGIIGAVSANRFSGGGIVVSVFAFVICTVACYFMCAKLFDS